MHASTSKLILLLALAVPGTASAATRTVCAPAGTCEFDTLHDAITGANPDDVIELGPGDWYDIARTYTKSLTLRGAGVDDTSIYTDANTTFIAAPVRLTIEDLTLRANTGYRVLHFEPGSAGSAIRNVAFENLGGTAFNGGYVLMGISTTLTIEDSTFVGGSQTTGGGAQIFASGGAELTIERSQFTGGAGGMGGCILFNGAALTITDTDFTACDAFGTDGAAIHWDGSPGQPFTLTGGTFTNNQAAEDGGALYLASVDVHIDGTTFDGNNAGRFGGAAMIVASEAELAGATLSSNHAASEGGAITFSGGSALIDGSLFFDNTSDGGGGAINAYAMDSVDLVDVEFDGNGASGAGGGLFVDGDGAPSVVDVVGGLYLDNSAVSGGGLYTAESTVSITGTELRENQALNYGGGLGFEGRASGFDDLDINAADFEGNLAGAGGGAANIGDSASVTVRSTTFCANQSSNDGGALRIDESGWIGGWLVSESVFVGNSAAADGGGLFWQDSGAGNTGGGTAHHNHFLGNDGGISQDGSALFAVAQSATNSLDFHSNLVAHNDADDVAVTLFMLEASVTLDHNAWFGNGTNLEGKALSSTAVLGDPKLYTPPPYDDTTCEALLWPQPDSPVLAAGRDDSDIGAFDGVPVDDVDGDGIVGPLAGGEDCDDFDDTVGGPSEYFPDGDGDGFGSATTEFDCDVPSTAADNGDDCDDGSSDVNPDADELCNGVDDDCDDLVDEADALDAGTWFADLDGDTFGDPDAPEVACDAPTAHVADDGDCDDALFDVKPGAPEVCDGVDNDCSGEVDDDALDAQLWYTDADTDSWGTGVGRLGCEDSGVNESLRDGDCDDDNELIFPGAPEVPDDDIDQDCDGVDAIDRDQDGDGQDSVAHGGTDCDDTDSTVFAGAPELPYDGIDQDCDGSDLTDVDGDGADGGDGPDCHDGRPEIGPDVEEIPYDAIDQDCSGADLTDVDGDGFDGPSSTGPDCDDDDPTVFPGAPDEGAVDEDCTGSLVSQVYGGADCGCSSSGGTPRWPLLLLTALVLRRRR